MTTSHLTTPPAVDLDRVRVHRMRDKASPAHLTLRDRLRAWWTLKVRHRNIRAGRDVVLKERVEIAICDTGSLTIGDHAFFHARTWLLLTKPHPVVEIGQWVFVGRHTIIAAKNRITIGDYTIFAPRCYVIDHEHGFGAHDIIHNQQSRLDEVVIGRDCYFGTGAIVLGGVHIGDGAVIGAGSVVTKDIPAYQMWAGNPARYIRDRT
jgi:acetyltransferase-like isoleucine patch superfamily enzyme